MDLTFAALRVSPRSSITFPILHPSLAPPYMLAHLLCRFIPTLRSHLSLLWTHDTRRRSQLPAQLSPACHDINTKETACVKVCPRVHEAATPPAGGKTKHIPDLSHRQQGNYIFICRLYLFFLLRLMTRLLKYMCLSAVCNIKFVYVCAQCGYLCDATGRCTGPGHFLDSSWV